MANLNNDCNEQIPEGYETEYDQTVRDELSNNNCTCYCGKRCKGLRGLKAHQRSCHVSKIPDLKDLFTPEVDCCNTGSSDEVHNAHNCNIEKRNPLPGLKLPRSANEWAGANEYLKKIYSLVKISAMTMTLKTLNPLFTAILKIVVVLSEITLR